MRTKTSKKKKSACLTFCAFYALYEHKKHLSESGLFAFCAFYAFSACEISSFKKKTALIPSSILLLICVISDIIKTIYCWN